jgi:hypothetical protein
MNSPFHPRRLRPLILAACAIGLALAVLDLLLTAALGRQPDWLPPRFFNNVAYFGSRVGSIEKLARDGQLDERRLAMVVGLSSAQYGLDYAAIERNDAAGRKWLILAGYGATIRNLEFDTFPVRGSGLRPSLIVLCIHPWMLHRSDRVKTDVPHPWLARHLWLLDNRVFLCDEYLIQRERAIVAIGRLFGQPLWETYEPVADPWNNGKSWPTLRAPEDYLAPARAALLFEMRSDQYSHNENEVESFHRVVSGLRQQTGRLVCVLMPESPRLTPMYTPEVDASFRRAVASLDQRLEVIDLRKLLPDEMFYDYIHLNSDGRDEFSAMFAAIVH